MGLHIHIFKNVEVVMKKIIIFLYTGLLFCVSTWAQDTCFLAKENQTVLKREGNDCDQAIRQHQLLKLPLASWALILEY